MGSYPVTGMLPLLLALAVLVGGCVGAPAGAGGDDLAPGHGPHPDIFLSPAEFYRGVWAAESGGLPGSQWGEELPEAVMGGVVPHHSLAAGFMADFFRRLAGQPVRTVVLLGPNHTNRGARIAASDWDWETCRGVVEADREMVARLVDRGAVTLDPGALEREHGVGTVIPFIGHYLPGTKVVPVIFHGGISRAEIEGLAGQLAALLDEGVLLVACVDFSHDLPRAEADRRDEETLELLLAGRVGELLRLGNEHLDSPAAVALLLLAAARMGEYGIRVARRANAADFLGNPLILETTSYFQVFVTRP